MPELKSTKVVIAAPMSFAGSFQRTKKMVAAIAPIIAAVVTWTFVGLVVLAIWWGLIAGWYLIFGLWLVPYRLMRRGQRKEKKADMRHSEIIEAVTKE